MFTINTVTLQSVCNNIINQDKIMYKWKKYLIKYNKMFYTLLFTRH